MSNALTKIYALQQRELNEQERRRQQQIAKQQRVAAAFNTSGLPDIFVEFRDVPLRSAVQQRVYKRTIAELCYDSNTPPNNRCSLSFAAVNGSHHGSRWYCEENPDTGDMRYCYHDGLQTKIYAKPQGAWIDHFIEYMAAAADTNVIASRIKTTEPHMPASNRNASRRQIQPI